MNVDYIIIGAGSAGCVLANRLTANGRHSVLLLEAGGDDQRLWLHVPIGYGRSFYNPNVNWMYRTEPDPGLDGRDGYWPRGKVLGGSSAINAMVFMRGHPTDFDDWAATGMTGWGWKDVLPYFKKLEDNGAGADELRSVGGPLHVSDVSRELHPVGKVFIEAALQAGLGVTPDFNGHQMEGVGPYQITTRDGWRQSAAHAYLRPAMKRANLRVETHAHATRIVFEGTRATGVAFRQHGQMRMAHARREVIVSAGAVNSPLLLQCSGVGPAPVLNGAGIDVLHDHPAVGRNLQDHLCIDHLYRTRVPTLNNMLRPLHGKILSGLQYLLFRRGPLSLSVNQYGGFVRTRPQSARPTVQLYFSPLSYTKSAPGKRPLMSPDREPGFLLSMQPCRPTSRGHIQVRSRDPFALPVIVPNSLSEPQDMEDMLDGIVLARRLAATPALSGIITREVLPGASVQSREEMIEDIRKRAVTVYHPVSTCRMGVDPRTSVVNQRLAVHGLDRLRVVDASVFPSVTSGNTNAPVIMVAEKAADLILEDAI